MEPENIAGFTRRCSVSLMVEGCVSYYRVGELIILDGSNKDADYITIFWISLGMCFWGFHDPIYITIRQCTST